MIRPKAFIIAGPNGSGKTTLNGHLASQGIAVPEKYINPDDIAWRMQAERPKAPRKEIEEVDASVRIKYQDVYGLVERDR